MKKINPRLLIGGFLIRKGSEIILRKHLSIISITTDGPKVNLHIGTIEKTK